MDGAELVASELKKLCVGHTTQWVIGAPNRKFVPFSVRLSTFQVAELIEKGWPEVRQILEIEGAELPTLRYMYPGGFEGGVTCDGAHI